MRHSRAHRGIHGIFSGHRAVTFVATLFTFWEEYEEQIASSKMRPQLDRQDQNFEKM